MKTDLESFIDLKNIHSGYGTFKVIHGVSLQLPSSHISALLGRNGMGKSTLIKTLMGMVGTDSGAIVIDGKNVNKLPSHKRCALGLGLVPEGRRIFSPLTVTENLMVAEQKSSNQEAQTLWTLDRLFDLFPRLKERASQTAGTLSGGEQQMLAIARALITQPKMLILDEATEGLAPQIRAEIWRTLRTLKDTGLGILLVDSRLHEVLALADSAHILQKGEIVWSGKPSELKANTELQTKFLGV